MERAAVAGISDDRTNGSIGRKLGLLGDVAQPGAFPYGDVATVRFDAALEDLKQSGLARTIGTDQPNTVAFRHRKGDVLE